MHAIFTGLAFDIAQLACIIYIHSVLQFISLPNQIALCSRFNRREQQSHENKNTGFIYGKFNLASVGLILLCVLSAPF